MTKEKRLLTAVIVFLVIAANLAFGLPRLSRFSAVDEPYWTYGRISKFWTSVAAHKWRSTSVNDKPGITVAILSGAGLPSINPMSYASLRGDAKTPEQLAAFEKINFSFRLPIFLFAALMLPIFFLLLRKLFNNSIALFSLIFIGLSPIILGMSLIINPDSLLWIFLPLSILSYLTFQKFPEKKYLYLSGVFLGLSLLTKYVANILYIYFIILIFLEYIFQEKNQTTPLVTYLKEALKNYGILVLISMATFFVLYPATWVSPKMLLEGTFLSKAFKSTWPLFAGLIGLIILDTLAFKNRATAWVITSLNRYKKIIVQTVATIFIALIAFTILNTYLGMKPFDFQSILASPKGGEGSLFNFGDFSGKILADVFSLLFGLTPLVLLSFIFAITKNIRLKNETLSQEKIVVFYFTLFILFYYVASTVNHVVATVRYQIILYPLASIMAAIGLYQFANWEKIKKYATHYGAYFVLIGISLFSLVSIKPFYLSYASSLLPQQYILNLKDMGDGSYESSQYLNSLPNARQLTIWSDKGAVCESFVGTCKIGLSKKDVTSAKFDYFVVSTGRKSRTTKLSGGVNNFIDFKSAYTTDKYAKIITIGDRPANSIRIIPGSVLYQK
jgi:hypothetical protein